MRCIHTDYADEAHMCLPPSEGDFCDERGKATTPTTDDYMSYTDKSDRTSNNYPVSQRMRKQ